MNIFTQRLRAFRQSVGWTQEELAEAIPVSLSTYRRWETGRLRRPPVLSAQRRLEDLMVRYHFDPDTLSVEGAAGRPILD